MDISRYPKFESEVLSNSKDTWFMHSEYLLSTCIKPNSQHIFLQLELPENPCTWYNGFYISNAQIRYNREIIATGDRADVIVYWKKIVGDLKLNTEHQSYKKNKKCLDELK
jgi:hypothetical protein